MIRNRLIGEHRHRYVTFVSVFVRNVAEFELEFVG